MNSKNRVQWIDICKGIGIILVIIGHSPRDIMREKFFLIDFIFNYIYLFHMPLFFILSGLSYRLFKYNKDNTLKEKYSMKQFIVSKFKSLFIPWIMYTLLVFIAIFILNQLPVFGELITNTSLKIEPFFYYIKESLLMNNKYSFHLWFIYVLFIVQIIYNIVDNIFCDRKYINLFILFILFFSFFIDMNIRLLPAIMHCLYYFCIGVIIGNYLNKFNYLKKEVVLFVILSLITFFTSFLRIDHQNYAFLLNVYNVIFCPLMCISIIVLFKNKYESEKQKKMKLLSYLGINSYNIYLLHQPIVAFFGEILVKKLGLSLISCLFIMIFCICISIVIPLVTLKIIKLLKMEKGSKLLFNLKYVEFSETE